MKSEIFGINFYIRFVYEYVELLLCLVLNIIL